MRLTFLLAVLLLSGCTNQHPQEEARADMQYAQSYSDGYNAGQKQGLELAKNPLYRSNEHVDMDRLIHDSAYSSGWDAGVKSTRNWHQ